MKDRILRLMKSEGMTQQEFSRATGIAPASLSSIFNGRTAPTMKHAEALHRYFPRLSMAWLLFGEGEMFTLTDDEVASRTRVGEDAEEVSEVDPSQGLGREVDTSGTTLAPTPGRSGQGNNLPSQFAPNSSVHAREGMESRSAGPDMSANAPFGYPPYYSGMTEMVKYPDIKKRKIVEIRIFFDDGTFETFQGNG